MTVGRKRQRDRGAGGGSVEADWKVWDEVFVEAVMVG